MREDRPRLAAPLLVLEAAPELLAPSRPDPDPPASWSPRNVSTLSSPRSCHAASASRSGSVDDLVTTDAAREMLRHTSACSAELTWEWVGSPPGFGPCF